MALPRSATFAIQLLLLLGALVGAVAAGFTAQAWWHHPSLNSLVAAVALLHSLRSIEDPSSTMPSRLLMTAMPALPFQLTVVSNRSPDTAEVVEWRREPGSRDVVPVATGLAWPERTFSLGHLAVPMPMHDPIYRLGRSVCLATGIAIIVLHNLLDPVWPPSQQFDQAPPLWVALHGQMARSVGPFLLLFIYPLLPWIGVMLFGFGIAPLFERPAAERKTMLFRGGLGLTAAFVALRALDLYGDPNPWQVQPAGITATVIDFLNTTKYPPSLAFLLMTLGPAALLLAHADRITGFVRETLVMFGRAPFAFYVAHLFLIHALSLLIGVLQGFEPWQFLTIFFYFPRGYGVSLLGVYAAWLTVIAILYPLSRWVAGVKARRRDWWLTYL